MEFNPRRMSLARRRRGVSQRELAALLGCDERSVRKWENGERTPTESFLHLLADKIDFPIEFFSRGDFEEVPAETVSFRALSKTKAASRDRAIAGGVMALELSEWLGTKFVLPPPELPDLRHYRETPEEAALALRTRWGLGDKPVKSMIGVLEYNGVRVFSLAEDCIDLDAFSFWRGATPFMFLNTLKSSERSRFDAAHELGHLAMHRHGEPTGRVEEREADAFAAAFLMPRSSVTAYGPRVPTLAHLVKAKQIWNVSVSALAHRLHEVGMITDWQYRSLCIQIQKLGMRKNEPASNAREMSQVFEKIFSSLRTSGIGKRELAASLSWPVAELNALVFGLILSASKGGGDQRQVGRKTQRPDLRLVK